jgi:hypothetical protein
MIGVAFKSGDRVRFCSSEYVVVGQNPVRDWETIAVDPSGRQVHIFSTLNLTKINPTVVAYLVTTARPSGAQYQIFHSVLPRYALGIWDRFTLLYDDGSSRTVSKDDLEYDGDVVLSSREVNE